MPHKPSITPLPAGGLAILAVIGTGAIDRLAVLVGPREGRLDLEMGRDRGFLGADPGDASQGEEPAESAEKHDAKDERFPTQGKPKARSYLASVTGTLITSTESVMVVPLALPMTKFWPGWTVTVLTTSLAPASTTDL